MTNTEYSPLFAKSRFREDGDDPPTVEEHCRAVSNAATAVWDATADDWRRALGEHAPDIADLRPILRIAAWLHDIGKANDAFQDMVKATGRDQRQPVRHEIISAVIAWSDDFAGEWLKEALGEDFWPVLWAIGGHHLQLRRPRFGETEDPVVRTARVGNRDIRLYLDSEVSAILEEVRGILDESGRSVPNRVPPLTDRVLTTDEDDLEHYIGVPVKQFVRDAQRAWRSNRRNGRIACRTAVLKALLMAADIAGSALQPDELEAWARKALRARIDESSLLGVVRVRDLRNFQEKVREDAKAMASGTREHEPVTIIEAGCGNGKTSAAYLWAQSRGVNRKLFFCYPTTGTTSAGYSEYLDDQKELKSDLLHSRAPVDRLELKSSPDEDPTDPAQKVEALRAWGKQVIACTVDQVLGLLQNNRRPLFASPAIAGGAFVFDEIHSYDDRLFRELLRFLELFPGIPTLLMSASIPPARREALKGVLCERMSEPIHGDECLEKITRYVLERRDDAEACWSDVAEALANGKKVLWVCNTVANAVDVFQQAADKVPEARRLLYHSRFRYGGDPNGNMAGWAATGRAECQKDVIAEFDYADDGKTRRAKPGAALAVTTQVCEMSLDLDADLLVTARCPLPALVQRLGRLHRFAQKNDPKGKRPRRCLVYPFEGRPYHAGEAPAQMKATDELLDDQAGELLRQRDLAERLKLMHGESEAYNEPLYSAWLDGGWQSEPLPTREGSNSLTLLRAEDVEQTAKALGKPAGKLRSNNVIPLTIPMLIKRRFQPIDRVAGYPVAAEGSVRYSDEEGASWAD